MLACIAIHLVLLAGPALGCPSKQGSMESAWQAVTEGQFRTALEFAQEEPDTLRRAQAELHVYHQAGALDQAFAAGLRGLQADPQNSWLLEQTAFVALTLGLGKRASTLLEELEAVKEGSAPTWMRDQAKELVVQRQREGLALGLSRQVALALMALMAGAIGYFARKTS
ncbi:MAG: hypothetical protein ACI9F9_001937 [Candidatus Paceibacteria bacterium]|jgi:hypothetical protein